MRFRIFGLLPLFLLSSASAETLDPITIQMLMVKKTVCNHQRLSGADPLDKTAAAYTPKYGAMCADIETKILAALASTPTTNNAADLNILRSMVK